MSARYKSLKLFCVFMGITSTFLFGGGVSSNIKDTDDLISRRNAAWLNKFIEKMSAKDQLKSINEFKDVITTYRQQSKGKGYILPLGPKSKAKLREMSSWLYSNLVNDTFNQDDLPNIIQCSISLSECSFSAHAIFDALEYQLWSYNQEPSGLDDLGYTRLFYAMGQSQYFPTQSGYDPVQKMESYPGFDIHEHLGVIVKRQRLKIQYLRFDSEAENAAHTLAENAAHTLANIIIAYNMMSSQTFTGIRDEFYSKHLIFPLDGAISALADLFDKCRGIKGKVFIDFLPNDDRSMYRRNLYRGLLLDLIRKVERKGMPASSCFDIKRAMPTPDLKRHRDLVLDLNKSLNRNCKDNNKPLLKLAVNKKEGRGFEHLVGKQLPKLGNSYTIENNVYDPNLCSEIDFVITTKTGKIIRIEADGRYHFIQNVHGDTLTQSLNGESRMKTNILRKFGKVLRISGACNDAEYYERISSIVSAIKSFEKSGADVRFIPASAEYASL